jgi:hypothetical protein
MRLIDDAEVTRVTYRVALSPGRDQAARQGRGAVGATTRSPSHASLAYRVRPQPVARSTRARPAAEIGYIRDTFDAAP